MTKYAPEDVERKWQDIWEKNGSFHVEADPDRPKYYVLEMFPYPSGRIHMGHVRNYSIGDVVARFKRMEGYNVLHPMGWDAFGMPAENAAIKHGVHPASWTFENIDTMRAQLKRLGYSYDWRRELATCHPGYYVHEQKFFLDFSSAAWPTARNPRRTGARPAIRFWPTNRSSRAAAGVATIPWCKRTWSSGSCASRPMRRTPGRPQKAGRRLARTRPDHAAQLDRQKRRGPDRFSPGEAHGLRRIHDHGVHHPPGHGVRGHVHEPGRRASAGGRTDRGLPGKGKGPGLRGQGAQHGPHRAHRRRPGKGGRVQRGLLRKPLHRGADAHPRGQLRAHGLRHGRGHGRAGPRPARLRVREKIRPAHEGGHHPAGRNPGRGGHDRGLHRPGRPGGFGPFSGQGNESAKERIADFLEEKKMGRRSVNYRLRDWNVSRQRYWGAPIPVIYCPTCGVVPVPESDLPVLLPREVKIRPTAARPCPRPRNS